MNSMQLKDKLRNISKEKYGIFINKNIDMQKI